MWSERQLAAMEALGIPVYDFKGGADIAAAQEPSARSEEPSARAEEPLATEEASTLEAVHYRLGPWFLVFPSDIPAANFDWLRDLSSFIGGRPVQVSHVPADKVVIDCGNYAQNQLSPEQKQALWAQLKPALN